MNERAAPAVGLGVRWAFAAELADRLEAGTAPLGCVEIVPENFAFRHDGLREAVRRIARRVTVLSHGLAANLAGTDPLDLGYLRRLRALLDELDVAIHTDHLCVTGHGGGCLHDLLPPIPARGTVRRTAGRIRAVADALGRPVAVENVTFYLWPEGDLDPVDFVAEVVEAADCGLLLDVNNLVVNARNDGRDVRADLARLPLERVVHLHVAGGERWASFDTWVDTHGADVPDEVLDLLPAVLARTGPVPVIYERDSKLPDLDALLATCARVAAAAGRSEPRAPAPRSPTPNRRAAAPTPDPTDETARLDGWATALRARDERAALDGARRFLGRDDPRLPARLGVYRTLLRRTIHGVLEGLLPAARAARGAGAFAGDVEAFLDAGVPMPPVLRRVPGTFAAWAADARWKDAPAVRAAARRDLAFAEATVAPRGPRAHGLLPDLAPDRVPALCGSLHLCPAEANEPAVAFYRDEDDTVRRLDLSERAHALLSAALAGRPLSEAAAAWGTGAEDLAALEAFLRDLAERGVLLGALPSPPEDEAPHEPA